MLYVLLSPKTPGDSPQVVFATRPVSHEQLAAGFAATHTPKSAGFCDFREGIDPMRPAIRVFGWSESLKLHSHPDDARLISAMIRATLQTAPNPELG